MMQAQEQDEDFEMVCGYIPVEDTYRMGDETVPDWMKQAHADMKILPRGDGAMVFIRGHYMYAPPMVLIAKAGVFFSLIETEILQ